MTTSKPTYLNFRNYAYNMSTQRLSEQNAELLSDKTNNDTLLAISSIIAVIVALGHEQRAKKYKDYYNNLFIKQLQV